MPLRVLQVAPRRSARLLWRVALRRRTLSLPPSAVREWLVGGYAPTPALSTERTSLRGFFRYRRLPSLSASCRSSCLRRSISAASASTVAWPSKRSRRSSAPSARRARSWSSPIRSDSRCASRATRFIRFGDAGLRIWAAYQRSFARLRSSCRFSLLGSRRAVR
jgi:hypothetical protein